MVSAVVLTAVLIMVTALASAAELAIVDADKEHIKFLASGKRSSDRESAERLLKHIQTKTALDECASGCQVVITVSSLLLGIIGERCMAHLFIPGVSSILSVSPEVAAHITKVSLIVFFTLLQVLLGELLPKAIANRRKEKTAFTLVVLVDWAMKVFRPLIKILNGSGLFILKLLRIATDEDENSANNLDEILTMVSGVKDLNTEDRKRMTSALGFVNLKVEDIFSPIPDSDPVRFVVKIRNLKEGKAAHASKSDDETAGGEDEKVRTLVSLRLDEDMESVLKRFDASPYSRLPVYGKNKGGKRIIGLVHIKDVCFVVAKGLTEEVCQKLGYKDLSELSLEEFASACAEIDKAVLDDIEREKQESIKRAEDKYLSELDKLTQSLGAAEGHISEDLRRSSGSARILERARHRAVRMAENRAGERMGGELLFQHGFLKRDLLVYCSLQDDLADVRDNLNSHYASLAVVQDEKHDVLGILTSEDLLEVMLGNNIVDETDKKHARKAVDRKRGKTAAGVRKTINISKEDKFMKAGKGGR